MGKRVISILRPIVMALLIAASVTFTVLCITTAIISDTATVKAESVEHSHDGYTAWTSTTSLPDLAGSYYLTADVTIASGTWIVPTGTTCLCLNGHGIIGNNGNSVITVGSGAVLYLEDCLDTAHKYTVDANHLATVDDSLEGVEGVDYFTFTGGYITGAKMTAVNSVGGGVNIEGGALYINGGTIIGNSADRGGGVRCGGTLVMNGGAIRNNNANTASGRGQRNGGGLFINTTFTMNGGIITENWCANAGGAILLQSTATSFIMNGGAIVNNYNRGLSNNMAQKPVKIGSGAIIEGNVDKDGNPCDIWLLQSGNKIELLGELSNNKPIGVYMGTAAGTFTSGLSGKGTAVNFISTNDAYFVKLDGDGEAQLAEKVVSVTVGETVTYYDNVSDALSAWTDGSTLKLLKDVTAQITTSGGNKTLDLNDHSITYTGGTVIIVSGGTLRITDQSGIRTTHYYTPNLTGVATLSNTDTGYSFTGGYITGGVATEGRGGGLRVLGDGNVLFDSGTIFANSAGWGGGVWTSGSGSLTIEGTAAVIGNYSSGAYTSGGGIFMEGSSAVTMTGGSIRHNSAQWSGGGVRDCVKEDTGVRFTMTGGEITGNYANNDQGNGFCFDMATTFNIGGTARIIDNQGTNDVFMYNDRYLTIVSPFEEGALIGVTLQSGTGTFTNGWATYMGNADPADYFTSDIADYTVIKDDNGELMMFPENAVAVVKNGTAFTYYIDFNSALSVWGDGCTLTLLKDVSISSTIVITNGTKTLDLNGHGIKMTGTGRVFTVINGATFNITDGNPQAVHKFTVSNGLATVNDDLQSGYQTFTGGYITGGNAKGGDENGWGGCLVVSLGGKRATLNISGGTIIGNHCDMSGAAIRLGGDKNDNTVFNMTGGAIMYNTAGLGGAITWESNVIVKISGGVIDNNFVGSNETNVYLENGQKITVDSAFTAAASIGVKLQNKQGVFTSDWSKYMEAADPFDYFTSDDGSYEIRLSDGEAYVGVHVHAWTYTVDGNVITATCSGVNKGTCSIAAQTITINAANKEYDGQAVTVTLTQSDGWTAANGLEIPSIYYSDGVNAATTTAPVSVGTYTASITVGEKTATVEFEITRKTETKIDDKTGDEQNAVSVVGLDLELANIENKNPDANSISLVMTVETKTDETAVNADSIIETAKNKSLEFFEVKIEKTIDSITTVLDTTSNVLEIAVPYKKVNKRGLIVYSYHGDSVRTFVESDTKEDGTFRVDKENKLIYVYANKFSTYAIGYTPYYRVQTSLSLGSYEGKASVTIKNDADENISFTLESADAKNIVFPDVPKGQYTMTIIWEDGKTNTLTMTLTVGPKAVLSAITEQDAESETSEEQVEEQETQVYSPYIGTTDEYEVLTEDAKIETVAAEDGYVAYKAQAINREVGLVPRKREYMIKREFIFYI